jgi:hypothetical protein|tara:strand:+ start:60 stop:482 length:423 start_codon:yes stop_codon:yes gene_type:complete
MIKYKLLCKNCSDSFESWFASSKEFERLKKSKLLQCLNCNSNKIDKSLMAPSIINKQKKNNKDTKKFLEIKNKLKEYKKFIKNNFDYVGDNFAYEARSIHYNNKKKQKGIYGKASIKEAKELSEEGIEVETVPWINDKEN